MMKKVLSSLLIASFLSIRAFAAVGTEETNAYLATKVTHSLIDWSGEYLLAYDINADSVVVFNGLDAKDGAYFFSKTNDTVIVPSTTVTVKIAPYPSGYSVQVNGSTNDKKYLSGTAEKNSLVFNDAQQLNTITYDNSNNTPLICSNNSYLRYNIQDNRFRYYKASSYSGMQKVQLYKCMKIQINNVPVTGISLEADSITMYEGDTLTLHPVITPSDASNKQVSWMTSNASIAQVSHKGFVRAVSPGKATIIVQAEDGGLFDTCVVVVQSLIPEIEMSLSADEIHESATGTPKLTATITRKTLLQMQDTIYLYDDHKNNWTYSSVTFAANQVTKTTDIYLVDDDRYQGTYFAHFAAVPASFSSFNSIPKDYPYAAFDSVRVVDNDSPRINIQLSTYNLLEGKNNAAQIRIARNTANTDTALVVSIQADNEEGLVYNHEATIPVGQSHVNIPLGVERDQESDDSHVIRFLAQSAGFEPDSAFAQVVDQSLPDANISWVTAPTSVVVGDSLTVLVRVSNTGVVGLAKGITIRLYMNNQLVTQTSLTRTIEADGADTLLLRMAAPAYVGTLRYYAVVNEEKQVKELHYNNRTTTKTLTANAPYTATIQVDKTICKGTDTVSITGQLSGVRIANATVELYIINNGYRSVKNVLADNNGHFTYAFSPQVGQSGHFAFGACFPTSNLTTEMAGVDYYGMRLVDKQFTCKLTVNHPFVQTIAVKNTSSSSLHNLRLEATTPSNVIIESEPIAELAGYATANVSVSMLATAPDAGNRWIYLPATITADEGISVKPELYYYSRNALGQLLSSVDKLKTTFSTQSPRNYTFWLHNVGAGETGEITINLPSWIKSVSPHTLPSLVSGDSAAVTLQLVYNESTMAIHSPISGSISINVTNGQGLSLPYELEPVSELTGTLHVDVCDEYTYYADGHPHVQNAQVVVKHPFTGAVVHKGVTNANGILETSLPEGTYTLSVSADGHDSYTATILVSPGETLSRTVNLSVKAITVSWTVEETEIKDEYEIVTHMTYETSVPVPQVVVDAPSSIDANELNAGESMMYEVKIQNKGLIRAEDVTIVLPSGGAEFAFEPLAYGEPFDLAAQQAVVMPVKVTRLNDNAAPIRRAHDVIECSENMYTLYYWDCGTDRKMHQYGVPLIYLPCPNVKDTPLPKDTIRPVTKDTIPHDTRVTPIPDQPIWTDTIPIKVYVDTSTNIRPLPSIDITDISCIPCLTTKLFQLGYCYIDLVHTGGKLAKANEIRKCYNSIAPDLFKKHQLPLSNILEGCGDIVGVGDLFNDHTYDFLKAKGIKKETLEFIKVLGDGVEIAEKATSIAQSLNTLLQPCDLSDENALESPSRKVTNDTYEPEFITQFRGVASIAYNELIYLGKFIDHLIPPEIQDLATLQEQHELIEAVTLQLDEPVDEAMMQSVRPAAVTDDLWTMYIERINNTYLVQNGGHVDSDNFISEDSLNFYLQKMDEYEAQAVAKGYESTADMLAAEYPLYKERLEQKSTSVCAHISLQISQKAVMTRQAFVGTLSVYNGHETNAIENLHLTLNVYNEQTSEPITSHEFQIEVSELQHITGEQSLAENISWQIAAQETGVAKILFIPTKYAAPEGDVVYSFGGQLSYTDPFTGSKLTRELFPVDLTVSPSPDLELNYFIQRDVMGDNPLTEDTIELSEPAEFALLVNNHGVGEAKDVNITTASPQIIDNEKGLAVDFSMLYSLFNGSNKTLPLNESVVTSFGAISAHQQAYAQWFFSSSLLGHFSDYQVSATHVSSYNNPDLSLLDTVTIHELIHTAAYPSSNPEGVVWLTNEKSDLDNTPDSCFFSDGTHASLHIGSAQIAKQSNYVYHLTLTPSANGWNYAYVSDPTNGSLRLQSITRVSDNANIDMRNVWQTSYVCPDAADPVHAPRIHVADELSESETYILNFAQSAQPVSIYSRTVPANSWGTICLPWQSISLTGGTFYQIAGKTATNVALVPLTELAAGNPYLFHSTGTEIKVGYLEETQVNSVVDPHLGIVGSFVECDVPEGKYIIYDNQIYQAGYDCHIGPNRAYLDLDNMPTYEQKNNVNARFISIHGKVTGVKDTEDASAATTIQKMIVDGQFLIICNGRLYNAQGQGVK